MSAQPAQLPDTDLGNLAARRARKVRWSVSLQSLSRLALFGYGVLAEIYGPLEGIEDLAVLAVLMLTSGDLIICNHSLIQDTEVALLRVFADQIGVIYQGRRHALGPLNHRYHGSPKPWVSCRTHSAVAILDRFTGTAAGPNFETLTFTLSRQTGSGDGRKTVFDGVICAI